ncbi:hypothetical protein PIROE2DRAFT_69992 [Piromyces sp. E2]|nr:hypothetical protein PIROE2DRAFT_69992 [Piromyces sp. E2]|eukprot:OUM58189.1 hypothetical protein PIROE2DRAFT_69992 [Piromyces sp. E2]
MKSIACYHYISVFFLWILFITKGFAAFQNVSHKRDITNIKILMDKPDSIVSDKWNFANKDNEINNYLSKTMNNVIVNFYYNDKESTEKKSKNEYEDYVKFIIEQLKNSNYDMFILDEKFIFSDVSNIESSYIQDTFHELNIHNYYLNLSDFFEKNKNKMNNNAAFNEIFKNVYSVTSDNNIYDEDMVKGGFNNNILYGLPFEMDLDVEYIVAGQGNQTIQNDNNKILTNIADDDKLLATFVNFMITNGLNNETPDEKSYYNILTNKLEKNKLEEELLIPFSKFIKDKIDNKLTTINNINSFTLNNVYKNFIYNEGNNRSFYGKASHFCSIVGQFENNSLIQLSLLHKKSVRNKKYLVINKNSKIDKDMLFQVALQLSSSDFQTAKYELSCKLPAYNFNVINSNFSNHTYFNNIIKQTSDFVNIKKMFESQFGAPYMEVRAFLPEALKKFIIDGNAKPVVDMLENIQYLVMDKILL